MTSNEAKDLFLCHNGADKDWVEGFGASIEGELWNGRRLSVFFDKWDIEAGDNILLKLNRALDQSRFVAVVMTPEMMRSEWCMTEVTATLANDPTNRMGRLIPLLLRDRHLTTSERLAIPPILRPLNYLDFRTKKQYRANYPRLLAKLRGEPPPRGRARRRAGASETVDALAPAFGARGEDPDDVPEGLIGNLLSVKQLPGVIWSAPTKLRTYRELPAGEHFSTFILKEERLFTCADMQDDRLDIRQFIDPRRIQRHAVRDWRDDEDRWRWVIELLNRYLREHLYHRGVRFDGPSGRYFFAPRKGKSAVLRWGRGDKRRVARAPDEGTTGSWVHQAARLNFESLGGALYLAIDPTWLFTTDGRSPIAREFVGPLTMKWGGKERNGTILRHVLMWSEVIADGRKTAAVRCGSQTMVIARLPTVVRMPIGIVGDVVRVGALLKFTQAELDLTSSDEDDDLFGYVDADASSEGTLEGKRDDDAA